MYGFSICQECFVDDIHYIAVDNGAGKVIQVADWDAYAMTGFFQSGLAPGRKSAYTEGENRRKDAKNNGCDRAVYGIYCAGYHQR